MGFYPVVVVLQQDVTHNARTKRSTQSYSNNKGHITHNGYETKK
jgi:hypothetical protein